MTLREIGNLVNELESSESNQGSPQSSDAPTAPNSTGVNTKSATADTRGDKQSSDKNPVDKNPVDKKDADAAQPPSSPNLLPTLPGESIAPIQPDDDGIKTALDPELANQLADLRVKLRKCLDYYQPRHEDAAQRSPWGIMHAMLSFGADSQIFVNNRKVNAIGWLCWNGSCRGMQLFHTEGQRIIAHEGPGFQGHAGQFLAMLAQCRVQSKSPMRISEQDFTVANLIASEMATCKSGTELTFKLIGLSHYLQSDAQWRSDDGQVWTISRLIEEELAQPVVGAACGGTHRMMGFSYAVKTRRQRGEPIDGEWLRAQKYVHSYIDYTYKLQNPDGSFSTRVFEGRGFSNDIDEHIRSTGHVLEWMVFSLSDEDLFDPRLLAAVNFLVDMMLTNHNHDWEVGPKCHAIRSLVQFEKRLIKLTADEPSL